MGMCSKTFQKEKCFSCCWVVIESLLVVSFPLVFQSQGPCPRAKLFQRHFGLAIEFL